MTLDISRRAFIAASLSAAGGLVVAVTAPAFGAAALHPEPWGPEGARDPGEINAFVVIEPDDSVLLRIAKSEMGQGVMTSLAMIVAEELECDFAKVRVEYASANRNVAENSPYRSMGTGGSSSVRRSRVYLQQAGASARARLVSAAAKRWQVDPATCAASAGRVICGDRSASYGELASDAAKITLRNEPEIKTPDQFTLMGTRVARLDSAMKARGEAI